MPVAPPADRDAPGDQVVPRAPHDATEEAMSQVDTGGGDREAPDRGLMRLDRHRQTTIIRRWRAAG